MTIVIGWTGRGVVLVGRRMRCSELTVVASMTVSNYNASHAEFSLRTESALFVAGESGVDIKLILSSVFAQFAVT